MLVIDGYDGKMEMEGVKQGDGKGRMGNWNLETGNRADVCSKSVRCLVFVVAVFI